MENVFSCCLKNPVNQFLPQSDAPVDTFENVSINTVLRIIESPITGKSFTEAAQDYKKNKWKELSNACNSKHDACKQKFAEAITEKLYGWSPGGHITFSTVEKGEVCFYRLYDDGDDDSHGIVIEKKTSEHCDQGCHHGVSLSELKRYCLQLNDQGAEAQFQLGFMCEKGIGCERDHDKAFDYFKQAAGQGHAVARSFVTLAKMIEYVNILKRDYYPDTWVSFTYEGLLRGRGNDTPPNYKEMMECAIAMANLSKQCVRAQFICAWVNCYESDSLVKVHKNDFLEQMTNCAQSGYSPAQYQLSLLLHEYPEAQFPWLAQAASQGYAPAQYRLYLLLKTIPGQQQESNQWLEKAAKQKYSQALDEITSENNTSFLVYAKYGKLYNGLADGNTKLPDLPVEITKKITSYNGTSLVPVAPDTTWFDDMLELMHWDCQILHRDG